MPLYPDPFSDEMIDAELPWPANEPMVLRGLLADDEYWVTLEPMRPRQHALTRAEMRQVA